MIFNGQFESMAQSSASHLYLGPGLRRKQHPNLINFCRFGRLESGGREGPCATVLAEDGVAQAGYGTGARTQA